MTSPVNLIVGWADWEFDEIDRVLQAAFPGQADWVGNYVWMMANKSLSLKVVDGDKIVGVYGLRPDHVENFSGYIKRGSFKDLYRYRGVRGMHGIALAVVPEYRNRGLGRRMILASYLEARRLSCRYVFGIQLRVLNNLKMWKKRRRHIGSSEIQHLTLVDL